MKKLFSKLTTAFGALGNRTDIRRINNNRIGISKPKNHTSGFVYPSSVQSKLFAYLKPNQQNVLRPILRIIKHPYQANLCLSLLDYLEGNGNQPTGNDLLDCLQQSIIEVCELHPLR